MFPLIKNLGFFKKKNSLHLMHLPSFKKVYIDLCHKIVYNKYVIDFIFMRFLKLRDAYFENALVFIRFNLRFA